MIRNRNGYWMSPKWFAVFAPDDGGGTNGGGADGGTDGNAAGGADGAGNDSDGGDGENDSVETLNAEIARLKAEMAKQKNALDKATHEASENKKAMNKAQADLRAKMTQEEIDAEAKKEAAEKVEQELSDLRKAVAKTNTVKSVMGKLGLDEDSAGRLADHLYGAQNIDNALLEIQKAWQAKEKALRLEYGKITGPGAGGDSDSPEAQAILKAREIGKQQSAVNEQAQKAINAYLR